MSDTLDDMYREIIMEHYRHPRGHHKLERVDVENSGKNPSCGDELELSLELDNGVIKDVSVGCKGCAISVASGSILSEVVKGKTLEETKKIAAAVKAILKGEKTPEDFPEELGDLEALQGVRNFPVRIKCALLSWVTLVNSLEAWEKKQAAETATTE